MIYGLKLILWDKATLMVLNAIIYLGISTNFVYFWMRLLFFYRNKIRILILIL